MNYERISKINTWEQGTFTKARKENNDRLKEILSLTKLDHIEKQQREVILKLIAKYEEVFALDSEPLPCTNLIQHEITLKCGKIINLRSHKLPAKHKEFAENEVQKLYSKGFIRNLVRDFTKFL